MHAGTSCPTPSARAVLSAMSGWALGNAERARASLHGQGLVTSCACAAAGLAVNQCLSRHEHGARLLQVGEQPLALGAKFRARVVLDITVDPLPQTPCVAHRCPPTPFASRTPVPSFCRRPC